MAAERSAVGTRERPPPDGGAEELSSLSRWTAIWRTRTLPQLAIGTCLVAMCLPAILSTYGLKDDFTMLASAHGYAYAGPTEPAESVRTGRPLYGLLAQALNMALPDVSSLWIARTLAMIGLALFAIVLYGALGPLVSSRLSAVAVTMLICSLPPFVVYVGWATLFPMPYSATLGAIAATFADKAAKSDGPQSLRLIVAGNIALLLALAIYQPTAMAFWLVALIIVLSARHTRTRLRRLLFCVALAGVPAMIGAFFMLKIGVWTLGAVSAQRAGLLNDLPTKLVWIPKPVGLALNLFYMPQSAVVAALGVCLVICGALLFTRDCARRTRVALLALAALAVPLSFAPSLLSNENYSTFRSLGPLTATLALFAALIFVSIERDGNRAWQRQAARGGLLTVAAVSTALGFNHLDTLLAQPLSREWRLVLSQVGRLPPNLGVVGFLAPTLDEGPITTQYGVRDELGVPGSAATWADPSLVWLAARQAGIATSTKLKVLVRVGSKARRLPGIHYIDMRSLKRAD